MCGMWSTSKIGAFNMCRLCASFLLVFLVLCAGSDYQSIDSSSLRQAQLSKEVNISVSTGTVDALMVFDTTSMLNEQLNHNCAAVVSHNEVGICMEQVLHRLIMYDKQCIKRYQSKILGYNLDILLRDPYDVEAWRSEAKYLHSFNLLQHVPLEDFLSLVLQFSTKALSKPIPYSEVLLPQQNVYPIPASLDYTFIDRYVLTNFLVSYPNMFDSATPWPHVVLDNVMQEIPLRHVVQEVLDLAKRRPSHSFDAQWRNFHDQNQYKQGTSYSHLMGYHTRELIAELKSMEFVRFLERLTKIPGLIPDPYDVGGGVHFIERGGYLKIHADFPFHSHLRLYRRVNILLYLNDEWEDDWAGHLELWSSNTSLAVKSFAPIFNRMVIFRTDSRSFHGHPAPLNVPDGVLRKSIALYYYTSDIYPGDEIFEQTTVFVS